MAISKLKQVWRKLRSRPSIEPKTIQDGLALLRDDVSDELDPVGVSMDIDGVRLVFGVRWSPISQDASLRNQLRHARKQGYAFYILTPQSDAVGLIGAFSTKSSARPHAASLILSEHFSTVGAELYLFEHEAQWSLVGLSDNSPMPGFDTMGTREEIEALAQEFAEMNAGQPIRYFGNVNWFSEISLLLPSQLVEWVDRRTKLNFIPNHVLRWSLLASGVLLLGGLAGANQYLNKKWNQEQAAALVNADNPNTAYEKGIAAALLGAGRAGNYNLSPWRVAVKMLPTQAGGWQLKSMECKADQCLAFWSRHGGNFLDFDNAFPYANSLRPDMVPKDDGQTELQTTHPAAGLPPAGEGQSEPARQLVRTQLPKVRDAYLQWASFLLDVKLMPNQASTFSAAKLFGSDVAIEKITRPVVRASWSLESDLWTLRDLFLPDYVVAEKLEIFPTSGNAGGAAKGQGVARDYRYKITGSFYAQGR